MTKTFLEHVNLTVKDPEKTADTLCRIFDWHIRWQGPALDEGVTVHVGSDDFYLALYSPKKTLGNIQSTYEIQAALNHIGVVVEDFEEVERRVIAEGFKPNSYQAYEPGRRFYFHDDERVEYEVVAY